MALMEVVLVKSIAGWIPATDADSEALSAIKSGKAMRFKAVRLSPRSLSYHRRYFALLGLAIDYWEPDGGLLTERERVEIEAFADWLDSVGANTGAIRRASKEYLDGVKRERSNNIDAPSKSMDVFHEWVKIEAGFFDWEKTPTGLVKKSRSINFNSLSEEGFVAFYKEAFSVLWRFVLSNFFDSEDSAMNAADRMLEFSS